MGGPCQRPLRSGRRTAPRLFGHSHEETGSCWLTCTSTKTYALCIKSIKTHKTVSKQHVGCLYQNCIKVLVHVLILAVAEMLWTVERVSGCERVTQRGAFHPPSIKEQVLWPDLMDRGSVMDGFMGGNRVERNMGARLVQVLIHGGRVFGTTLVLSTKTYQNVSKPVLVLSTKTYQSVTKRVPKVPKKSVLIRFDTK